MRLCALRKGSTEIAGHANRLRDAPGGARAYPAGRGPDGGDRLLATQFGAAAVDAVHDGASSVMTALDDYRVRLVSLAEATADIRSLPKALLDLAAALAG